MCISNISSKRNQKTFYCLPAQWSNCEGAPRGREPHDGKRKRERERERGTGGDGEENAPVTRGRLAATLLRLYSEWRRTASVPAAIRTPETAVSSFQWLRMGTPETVVSKKRL